MCWRSDTEELWTIDASGGELGTIDTTTGAFTQRFVAVPGAGWDGLAWDQQTERFFLSRSDDSIYSLDPRTGVTTLLGASGQFYISALDVDRDGTLWGISWFTGVIATIDKQMGVATPQGGPALNFVSGIGIDELTGCVYGTSTPGADALHVLTPSGGSTLVVPHGNGIDRVSGFDIVDRPVVFSGTSNQRFGTSVSDAGDVDGDGYDDVIIGAPFGGAGTAHIASGFDRSTLHILSGDASNDQFGDSVSGAGDIDADGFADLIAGARDADPDPSGDSGSASVFGICRVGRPAHHATRGAGCPGSDGNLPRIALEGRTGLGDEFALSLRGALPITGAALLIGSRVNFDLAVVGAPGCGLFVNPFITRPAVVNGRGFASTASIPISNDSGQIGLVLDTLWLVLDPTNNALGISASNAAVLHVGT